MEFQLRINSTNFTIIANIVPNIGGYKLVLGLDTLQDLKAEIDVSNAVLKIKKARIKSQTCKGLCAEARSKHFDQHQSTTTNPNEDMDFNS